MVSPHRDARPNKPNLPPALGANADQTNAALVAQNSLSALEVGADQKNAALVAQNSLSALEVGADQTNATLVAHNLLSALEAGASLKTQYPFVAASPITLNSSSVAANVADLPLATASEVLPDQTQPHAQVGVASNSANDPIVSNPTASTPFGSECPFEWAWAPVGQSHSSIFGTLFNLPARSGFAGDENISNTPNQDEADRHPRRRHYNHPHYNTPEKRSKEFSSSATQPTAPPPSKKPSGKFKYPNHKAVTAVRKTEGSVHQMNNRFDVLSEVDEEKEEDELGTVDEEAEEYSEGENDKEPRKEVRYRY